MSDPGAGASSDPRHEARTGPVLAVFAHPDDAEIAAGGTLAKWAAAGREVHLLVLTNGDRGSSDPTVPRDELAALRATETEAAAAVMGLATSRICRSTTASSRTRRISGGAVVRRIREFRAETVVSVDPTAVFFEHSYYNHSDHRNAGWIALDSCFPGSGNPHFFGEHLVEGLEVQEVVDVWLGWTNEPNHIEDVTTTFATKLDALARHASQLLEGVRLLRGRPRERSS